jgi:2-keto-4-pentenoate hydratase/2-oxohepta-3-ene-1,7-dioic acid hydratase in catechol pathway
LHIDPHSLSPTKRTAHEHRRETLRHAATAAGRHSGCRHRQYFPVRRLWCVGRNYVEHIKEMGQDVREPPFFFGKPADAIVPDGGTVP